MKTSSSLFIPKSKMGFSGVPSSNVSNAPHTPLIEDSGLDDSMSSAGGFNSERNIFDFKGQIIEMAKTQKGSKFLQRVLAKAAPEQVDFIIEETKDSLHDLMVD